MTALIDLPRYIQLGVYVEFLCVNDICCLDSAICYRLKRNSFLKLWSDTQATVNGLPDVTLGTQFLRWLGLRGINVFHLNLRLNIERACSFHYSLSNLRYLNLKEPTDMLLLQSQLNKNYSHFLERLFGECHSLTTLCVSGPKLKGFQPVILNCQSTLTRIDLCGIQNLTAECICSILKCPNAAALCLSNSAFPKGAYLGNRLDVLCSGLMQLNVESCAGFDDVLLSRILCTTPLLTSLNIAFTAVSPSCAYSCLSTHCHRLAELVYSRLTEGLNDVFSSCTQLSSLTMHHDPKYPFLESTLNRCSAHFNKLQTLKILNASQILFSEMTQLSSVTSLSLAGCTRASTDLLAVLHLRCPLLTVLDVTGCSRFSNLALANACYCRLTELRIAHCILNQPDNAISIARRTSLTVLDVSGVWMTDNAVFLIVDSCRDLRVLLMKSCKSLTSASYIYVAQHCAILRELSIDGSGVTDTVLDEFHFNCPELRLLDIRSSVVTVTSATINLFRRLRRKVTQVV